MEENKREREPYVPRPKTEEEIKEEKRDFWGMVASVIIVFGFYIFMAYQL